MQTTGQLRGHAVGQAKLRMALRFQRILGCRIGHDLQRRQAMLAKLKANCAAVTFSPRF
jgi:hypothetical protein